MARPLSPRLALLKERLFDEYHNIKPTRENNQTVLDREGVEQLPITMRKALAMEKVCQELPIQIYSHELIVGSMAQMFGGPSGLPFPRYETDEEAAYFAQWGLNTKSIFGHHLPNYPRILQKGYLGIIADIDAELAKIDPADQEGIDFLKSAKHCLQAACGFSLRYADLAEASAGQEADPKRRDELLEISRVCRRVPMHPPQSFHEALQSVWFVHMLLHSTMTRTPMGRIDQYLWPYYKADEKAGKIDQEQALDLIGSFWIKFNELIQYEAAKIKNDDGFTITNHWLQSATLSGLDTDGKDCTNTLSYLFLRSINDLELVSPMINARIHKDSPAQWIEFISRELCESSAQPVVFNDDAICHGLTQYLGMPRDDALGYCTDGCWEILPEGKTDFCFGMINLLPCIETLLNRGKTFIDEQPIGLDLGENGLRQLDTFEKFYEAFLAQVYDRIDQDMEKNLPHYELLHQIAPEPFLSPLVCGCTEKHRDLTHLGAEYTLYSFMATGMSHCIDSLNAIKQVVYDEKILTLEEVAQVLRTNWKGHEQLRQYCLNRTPKYGNDDDGADALLTRFVDDFCDRADYWNKKLDWLWVTAGIATFENFIQYGAYCGASFDGRFSQEPLSSNYSPAVGRDKEGLTAAVLSSVKPNLPRMANGCPLDLRFSFNKQSMDECAEHLKNFILSFQKVGGMMMTLSRVDQATLLKAQKEPEKYRSLRVRLGGVTVYFVQLAKEQQDEYMRRTVHSI